MKKLIKRFSWRPLRLPLCSILISMGSYPLITGGASKLLLIWTSPLFPWRTTCLKRTKVQSLNPFLNSLRPHLTRSMKTRSSDPSLLPPRWISSPSSKDSSGMIGILWTLKLASWAFRQCSWSLPLRSERIWPRMIRWSKCGLKLSFSYIWKWLCPSGKSRIQP